MPQSVPQVPAVASGVGRCRTTEKRVFDGQVEKMESKPAKSLELEREESEPLIYSKLPTGCLYRVFTSDPKESHRIYLCVREWQL